MFFGLFKKPDSVRYRDKIRAYKKVTISGMSFVIRKLNPILDFQADQIPQIFSGHLSRRPTDPNQTPNSEEIKRLQNDMKATILAGVVEPKFVPVGIGDKRGKEDGITVEDVFRDPFLGYRLYFEIVAHSLNIFSGIKGVFFSIRIRLALWIQWQRDMVAARQIFALGQKEPR